MTRFVGYIAMSLDGRIAARNDDLGWLIEFGMPEEAQADYDAFYEGVDAIVMGRTTYDWVERNGNWPYGNKAVHVVTRSRLDPGRIGVTTAAPDFEALRERLVMAGHETVWVMGGGHTLRGAINNGMLDHLRVFVMPIVVGSGPLLFSDGRIVRGLKPVGARIWPGDVTEIAYEIGAAE